jgi:hypothetical protein
MIAVVCFFLLGGMGLELPQLGYLPSEDGRVRPLYGMRGVFLLGDPLPKATPPVSAARSRSPVRSLILEGGRQWLLATTAKGEPIRTALPVDRVHGLDAKDRLWWADAEQLSCGERRWPVPAPVRAFVTLADGWMAVRTSAADYAARCDDSELYLLPRPE